MSDQIALFSFLPFATVDIVDPLGAAVSSSVG